MDNTTRQLAAYVTSLRYEDLTPAATHMTKKLLIDAIGCAIGKVSMAILAVEENTGWHCRSILTQVVING